MDLAAVCGGLLLGWPAALVLVKPTLAPFMLIGARDRRWWAVLGGLLVASLLLLPLMRDWFVVLTNARGEMVGPFYVLGNFPLMLDPGHRLARAGDWDVIDRPGSSTSDVDRRTAPMQRRGRTGLRQSSRVVESSLSCDRVPTAADSPEGW